MMIACGIPVDKDVDVLEGVQGQAFVGAVGILFGLAPSKRAPLYRLNVPAGVLRLSKLVSATLPDVSTLPTHAHGRVDSSDSEEEEEKVTHTALCVTLVTHRSVLNEIDGVCVFCVLFDALRALVNSVFDM